MSHYSRKSFLVVHNPTAGQRKSARLTGIVERLRFNGAQVQITPTTHPGHATDLARKACQLGNVDCVVAAGGDGTISETATGLMQAREDGLAYDETPSLGIVPMGTANVMAHDLKLVRSWGIHRQKIVHMLLSGQRRSLYLGVVENAMERRAFVMMVGAGFDARVVADIDLDFKQRFGKIAYIRSGITTFLRGCKKSIVLENAQGERLPASQWVIVSNGKHYAGGYVLTRKTSLFERNLVGLALKGSGQWALLKGNAALGLQKFDTRAVSQRYVGTKFTLSCGDNEGLAEVDGDYFSRLPVTVGLAQRPIPFLEPL